MLHRGIFFHGCIRVKPKEVMKNLNLQQLRLQLPYFAATAIIVFCLLIISTFSSCKKDCFPLKGKGNIVNESFNVSSFKSIDLAIDAELKLTQGDSQFVRISGHENILDIISVSVSNETLVIKYTKNCGSISDDDLQIQIQIPEVNKLRISGSGDIQLMNTIQSDNLQLEISGSGELDGNIQSNSLTAQITGSGDIDISGSTTNNNLTITGSGEYSAFNLVSQTTDIHISGSGNADIHVIQTLDASISGSGKIRYKGNPIVTSSISGSGDLIHVN